MSKKINNLGVDDIESYAKIHPIKKAMRTKAFPLLVLFAVMVIFYAIFPQLYVGPHAQFFQRFTFFRMVQDIAVPGLLTIGTGMLIVAGGIDLSTGAVGSFAGVIMATGVAWRGWSWWVAILVAIVACAIIGLVNAVIINELKLPAFVVTIAMTSTVPAIAQIVSTNEIGTSLGTVNFRNLTLEAIGRHRLFGELNTAGVVVVVLFIIYGLLLSKTKFGRTLYLMGGNRAAARLAGINEKRIMYFLFINCSVMAAFAGILNATRTGLGGWMTIVGHQFTGITAAILGGISFGGGSGGLGGAFMGLIVLQTFAIGNQISGATAYLVQPAGGALLLLALTFDYFNIKKTAKRVNA